MNGFIKLHRQLKEWEWYTDTNVKSVFIHCLLSANFKDKNWRGTKILRGQFITSYSNLAAEIGLSVRNVRTALDKLEQTNEIKRISTSQYTIISICKFDSYQENEGKDRQGIDKPLTDDRQTTDTQPTTTEEGKESKEGKEKYIYLEQFRKIQNGDEVRKTQLDVNFHLQMFPGNWSDEFKDSVLSMWRYLENGEPKPKYWGKTGTITSQMSVLKSSLQEFSENEVIKAFEKCKFASKKSWPMYLKKEENPAESNSKKSGYTLGQKIHMGKC